CPNTEPGTRLELRKKSRRGLETREAGSRGRGPTPCLGTEPGWEFEPGSRVSDSRERPCIAFCAPRLTRDPGPRAAVDRAYLELVSKCASGRGAGSKLANLVRADGRRRVVATPRGSCWSRTRFGAFSGRVRT